jgi:hypothetical protein
MSPNVFSTVNSFINQYVGLFPIGSLCIFLVFAALKMWNCRVAWFLSLSAPGAIVLPIMIVELLVNPSSRRSFIGILLFSMLVLPGLWVFPIVFVIQFRSLLKKKWEAMSPYSYVGAAILLGLYFWTDFIGKGMMSNKL